MWWSKTPKNRQQSKFLPMNILLNKVCYIYKILTLQRNKECPCDYYLSICIISEKMEKIMHGIDVYTCMYVCVQTYIYSIYTFLYIVFWPENSCQIFYINIMERKNMKKWTIMCLVIKGIDTHSWTIRSDSKIQQLNYMLIVRYNLRTERTTKN